MRVVIQRVQEARVEVDGVVTGAISKGLLVLLGVARDDTEADAAFLAEKTLGIRIFPDEDGKMNRSVVESGGGVLVVSQFTLYGDVRKGRRPSFDAAAPPELARDLYEKYLTLLRKVDIPVQAGIFQAMMKVYLVNDGPVTILCDSAQSSQRK
jgi:D-tyrosyl-tRNA(Tyr) deacylase